MPDPATLRDSTQIVLPRDCLRDVRDSVEGKYDVTVFPTDDCECRIIGSPVEIKAVSQLLARHGVSVP